MIASPMTTEAPWCSRSLTVNIESSLWPDACTLCEQGCRLRGIACSFAEHC
jgi:hypothetical protein